MRQRKTISTMDKNGDPLLNVRTSDNLLQTTHPSQDLNPLESLPQTMPVNDAKGAGTDNSISNTHVTNNAVIDNHSNFDNAGEQEVMGGLSGSIAYGNNKNDQEQYADPGLIVAGDNRRRTQIETSFGNESIVINADTLKYDKTILEGGKSVFQSFVHQVTGMDNNSSTGSDKLKLSKVVINEQVKLQHEENKRIYQGRPGKDSKHYNITPEPCLARYLVTKIRNWRAGYARILSLHKSYFTTLDPDTHEVTNLWHYSHVRNYMAAPQERDCMMIDVMEDSKGVVKLKFKCSLDARGEALTSFAEYVAITNGLHQRISQGQHPTFMNCQRLTRRNARYHSALVCAPHGLIELDPQTGSAIRTYLYRCIKAVSFLSDDTNGIVIYVSESGGSIDMVKANGKVWFVFSSRPGGSGRSELITVLKNKFEILALSLTVTESAEINNVLRSKLVRGLKVNAGETMGVFPVRKFSKRAQMRSSKDQEEGVKRYLSISRNGFLLELDGNGNDCNSVASCRPLLDIANIVRNCPKSSYESRDYMHIAGRFTIEYKEGLCRTYACSDIDAVIVPILDASVNMCKNYNVTVTDMPSAPYRILSFKNFSAKHNESGPSSNQNLLQVEPIEVICLRNVHRISSVSYGYVDHIYNTNSDITLGDILIESFPAVECCREFNSNVPIQTACNIKNDKKIVEDSINALWGVCSILLEFYAADSKDYERSKESQESIHASIIPIFQTLYRLMLTETGFKSTAKNDEVISALVGVYCLNDSFALYWSMKCLSALLLPRPFAPERDTTTEVYNKNALLHTDSNISTNLIDCMMGQGNANASVKSDCDSPRAYSDLVLMVCSNIVESLLCSHRDTTSSNHAFSLTKILSARHSSLMALLQSSTSVILENATVILRILINQSSQVASLVRENVMTSGMLLNHFYHALFSKSSGQRLLSRYLCGIWMDGADCAERQLLVRTVPPGFFSYLKMPKLSLEEETQLDFLEASNVNEEQVSLNELSGGAGTDIGRFRLRIRIAESSRSAGNNILQEENNFRIFFHVLTQDHSLPDLIWNQDTRNDLRNSLKSEIKSIEKEITSRGGIHHIAWNHEQLQVKYPSLEKEVKVGTIYMQLWLQASDSFIKSWDDPLRLFELLFRRLLCDIDQNILGASMCIRCLERLYVIHAAEIGPFPDISILMRYMRTSKSIEIRHRLLSLVAVLMGIGHSGKYEAVNMRENLEQLLNIESITQLCEMSCDCHDTMSQSENVVNTPRETKVPATWHTAPSGKVPPAISEIQGPFTLRQLKQLLVSEKLNGKSLVSTFAIDKVMDDDNESTKNRARINDSVTSTWLQIKDVWQLKRQLFDDEDSGFVFTPTKVSQLSLECLKRLVIVHKSSNSKGIPLFPIPIAKRLICEGRITLPTSGISSAAVSLSNQRNLLPFICQCILCPDTGVVESAAELIKLLMFYNDAACRELHLTGIFFFVFSRTGSNWRSISHILNETHLNQQKCRILNLAEDGEQAPSKNTAQSILCKFLPEGLIKVLIDHGAEKFAETFVGNHDNPEVIWSCAMRSHLAQMVQDHLSDFPARLGEHSTLKYRYCPMPKMHYEELGSDIFCHNYYLRNLCDEEKFSNWPIHEPLSLFQACIQQWENLDKSKVIEVSAMRDARVLLELGEDFNDADLHSAYCKAARSTDLKEVDIDDAYSLLKPVAQRLPSGKISHSSNAVLGKEIVGDSDLKGLDISPSQLLPTLLFMKTQLMICKRYSTEIGKFKYPYKMLLNTLKLCLKIPAWRELCFPFTSVAGAKFLSTAVKLVFHSCLVSPLNGEQLICGGGVIVLESMLDSLISFLSSIEHSEEKDEFISVHMETTVHVVHTLAGVAYYENGRTALEALPTTWRFCQNWRKCIDLRLIGESSFGSNLLKRYALEGLLSMAKSEKLQVALGSTGVLWNLINSMLDYDPDLELVSLATEECERSISKAELNYYGGVAARAIGMLCGIMDGEFASHSNLPMYEAMQRILTKPIANLLKSSDSEDILRTLNLSIRTPLRLWDMNMRKELQSFLIDMEAKDNNVQDLTVHLLAANSFEYSNLSNELNIGGVYIRIFNGIDIEDAVEEIPDVSFFVRSLLRFIGRSIKNHDKEIGLIIDDSFPVLVTNENIDGTLIDSDEESVLCLLTDERFLMCLRTLSQLVKKDGLVDDIMCEPHSAGVIVRLISHQCQKPLFALSDFMMQLSPKLAFADALVRHELIPRFLTSLSEAHSGSKNDSFDLHLKTRWSILESLASSPSVASEIVTTSAWLELLGIIARCDRFTKALAAREGSAKICARLLYDSNISTTTASLLQQFIPPALLRVLKNNGADALLLAFDANTSTPDLLWDTSSRNELRDALSFFLDKIFDSENRRVIQDHGVPRNYKTIYSIAKDELCVGNVFVNIYLNDPSFELNDPSMFLEALLRQWTQDMEFLTTGGFAENSVKENNVALVTDAILSVCKSRPFLSTKIASWGYTPTIVRFILKTKLAQMLDLPLLSSIRLIHMLSTDLSNVEEIITTVDTNGRNGVVDGIMKAIDGVDLHPDTSFMIETLKIFFQTALGDVGLVTTQPAISNYCNETINVAMMAPSPAPGSEPVAKLKKVNTDHPLAMMLGNDEAIPKNTTKAVRPSTRQNNRRFVQSQGRTNSMTSEFASNPLQKLPHGKKKSVMNTTKSSNRQISSTKNHSQVLNAAYASQSMQSLYGQDTPNTSTLNVGQSALAMQNNGQQRQISKSTTLNIVTQGSSAELRSSQPTQLPYGQQKPGSSTASCNSRQASQSTRLLYSQQRSVVKTITRDQSQLSNAAQLSQSMHLPYSQQRPAPNSNTSNTRTLQSVQLPCGAQTPILNNTTLNVGQIFNPQQVQSQLSNAAQLSQPMKLPYYSQQSPVPDNITSNIGQPSQSAQLPYGSQRPMLNDTTLDVGQISSAQEVQSQLSNAAQLPQITQPLHYQQEPVGGPIEPVGALFPGNKDQICQNDLPPYAMTGQPVSSHSVLDPEAVAKKRMSTVKGASNSANGRGLLLETVLKCELVQFLLLNVLENPNFSQVKEFASAKKHTVELLELLQKDPGYGMHFELILTAVPSWRKHMSKDHNMMKL